MPEQKIHSDQSGRTDYGNFGRGTFVCHVGDYVLSEESHVVDGQPAVTLFGEDHFCDEHAQRHQTMIEEYLASSRTFDGAEQARLQRLAAQDFLKSKGHSE